MITIALPTADRSTTHRFYLALGFTAFGDLADDGVPEPLQFELAPATNLMFIPTGGFGWVTGDHEVAPPGTSECLLAWSADSAAAVDDLVARAEAAGAAVVSAPQQQPWGYEGTFADPDGHLWQVLHTP